MSDSTDRPLPARLAEALGDAYTIEGEIGRGGMGVVYRAQDERLQRRVAIKVLPPELAYQQEIRQRFTREAQTAAKLSHPHVVPIYTVGEGKGLVYFVMGYVDGESVGGRIKRRGRLPVEEVRRIMKETADALSAAHNLSIIHRDIKPDNILLEGTRGRVMVTDFGIAKALSATSGATLTGVGVAIGTPSFMSPEQAAGEREIDGRSDLYSLGIVAYQMLSGELPFTAPTVAGILMKQITEPAPDIRDLRNDVPEDLALAVARCLEKDPENRWPTADALRRALENRVVTGYQPTGLGWKASRPPLGGTGARGTTNRPSPTRGQAGARPTLRDRNRPSEFRGGSLGPRPLPAPRAPGANVDWPARRSSRRSGNDTPLPDTGEPKIVQKVRAQFGKWAAVSGGLMMLNVATGIDHPWFMLPAAGMGIGLLSNYSKLWQAGYSWRDVLSRPPAHDAVETTKIRGGKLPKMLPPPKSDEFGAQYANVMQIHGDRQAVLRALDRMDAVERKQLPPEITETADGLYNKALELARTLHSLDSETNADAAVRLDERIEALKREPDDADRARRLNLLERQRQTYGELQSRRGQVATRLDECMLAMQTMRLDLMKLRSEGIGSVLGGLTMVTQQAKALSRDVDNAISAAAEIREALR